MFKMLNDEQKEEVIGLIRKLRNSIDPEINFARFDQIIKNQTTDVISSYNTKWLVSICDTYADYGTDIERRNALYVTWLVAMSRLADSLMAVHDIDLNSLQLQHLQSKRVQLYDGIKSLHFNRQDTLLNLAKRTKKNMSETPALLSIYKEVNSRMKVNSFTLSKFIELTGRPSHVLPDNPEDYEDNHGIK